MQYKLIASDLDGTLLNAAHQISAITKQAIQALVARGFSFVIATGRHFLDVAHIHQELDVETTYTITANGARIHNHAGEIIYQKNIDPPLVKALFRPEFRQNAVLNIYRDDGWFISEPLPRRLLAMYKGNPFKSQLFSPSHDNGIGVSKVFYIADHATLLNLQYQLEAYFGKDALAITFSLAECLEVMAKTVSKGNAIRQVAQLQQLSLADCLAFGDGLNDYELLSSVGKGVLMGNAYAALKAALPRQEIIGLHNDDAVAKYLISHYKLPVKFDLHHF